MILLYFQNPNWKAQINKKVEGDGGGWGWRRLDHDNYHKADTVAGQGLMNIIYPIQTLPFGDVYSIPSL